jgi:hypothetical protein
MEHGTYCFANGTRYSTEVWKTKCCFFVIVLTIGCKGSSLALVMQRSPCPSASGLDAQQVDYEFKFHFLSDPPSLNDCHTALKAKIRLQCHAMFHWSMTSHRFILSSATAWKGHHLVPAAQGSKPVSNLSLILYTSFPSTLVFSYY